MNGSKVLITGFSGFVSRHFIEYLRNQKISVSVLGIDVKEPDFGYVDLNGQVKVEFKKVNLLDEEDLFQVIDGFRPDYVLHLASFSSVAYSWESPIDSFRNNTNIFLNLIMAIKSVVPKCRILSVGSSEEYGNVDVEQIPLVEEMELRPNSPYAVARVSQEMIARVFCESYGLDIVLTRSFNHIGPYQDTRFVVPSFVKQIIDLKKNNVKQGMIEVGDISIIRDFVDVRDVVVAYYKLLLCGKTGEVYNICSGKGIRLADIIDVIAKKVLLEIKSCTNEKYMRPVDNHIIVGSMKKIHAEIGWQPLIPIEQTIQDMINVWIDK